MLCQLTRARSFEKQVGLLHRAGRPSAHPQEGLSRMEVL